MTSRAPGGWSPYGGPVPDEPAAPPPREPRRPPWFLATLAILEFFAIVVLAGWLYWKYHHDKPAGPTSTTAGVTSLSHVSVETFIADRFQATGVSCNDGANFPMTSNGATFPCTADDGKSFTVIVTDKATGDYTVRPAPAASSTPSPKPKAHHKHKKH